MWKPVSGWEGAYEVSTLGEVRNTRTGHVLKPMVTGARVKGGRRAVVRFSNTPRIDYQVAHLVLQAFVGPRPDGAVSMHMDDDTMNNRVDNLRWATPLENARDCSLKKRGGRQKLTVQQMVSIANRRAAGERGVDLAREFGVSQQTICGCFKRRGPKWAAYLATVNHY